VEGYIKEKMTGEFSKCERKLRNAIKKMFKKKKKNKAFTVKFKLD